MSLTEEAANKIAQRYNSDLIAELSDEIITLKAENATLRLENKDIHALLFEAFTIYPYEDESGIKKITLNDYTRIRNWMIESALLTAEQVT